MKRTAKKWNTEIIREKISTNDNWLFRGIVAIHSFQTADEKSCKETVHRNRRGFNKADAKLLSSFAEILECGGRFTESMLITARKRMMKYVTQLTRIANENQPVESTF